MDGWRVYAISHEKQGLKYKHLERSYHSESEFDKNKFWKKDWWCIESCKLYYLFFFKLHIVPLIIMSLDFTTSFFFLVSLKLSSEANCLNKY